MANLARKIMEKKKLLIILSIIIAGSFILYNLFLKPNENGYITEDVVVGTVLREVSETGIVKSSDNIELSFKTLGEIEDIYVKAGDKVKEGQELVKLDNSNLRIQLDQAYADLELARAKKSDANVSLDSALQLLKDTSQKAENDLDNAYNDALAYLQDTYQKIYTAYNVLYDVQTAYFYNYQGGTSDVFEAKSTLQNARDEVKNYIDDINSGQNGFEDKIDNALAGTKEEILKVQTAINNVLDIVRSPGFKSVVSTTDVSSLETQRTNLNTAHYNIVSSEQSISSTKASNETNINSAKSTVLSLQNQLSQNSSSLYSVQERQAMAKISLLENQIKEAVLKSPIDGMIVKSEKKEGETVQAKEAVITVLSKNRYQIEADVYEGDIAKVREGNNVTIELVAFEDEEYDGKVVSIDPGEKLINDVVHYEVIIDMDNMPDKIMQGMTADVVIEVARKENVLTVPIKSVEKINGKKIVEVLKNGSVKKVEVEIGLEGDDYIEIISGLEAGEKVILGKKI